MALAVAVNRPDRTRGESRAQTRQRLLAFGRRAFARKGHVATNLREDILEPAGVSVGSFYHQFRDKTDLFLAILEHHGNTFRAMIREAHTPAPTDAPADVARQSFATVFRIADENDDLFRIMARERESPDPRVRAYLRESQREWIVSLVADYRRLGFIGPRDTRTGTQVAELVSALTIGMILRYLDLPAAERARQRARLIDGLVQFTLGGVAAVVANPPPRRSDTITTQRRKRGGH